MGDCSFLSGPVVPRTSEELKLQSYPFPFLREKRKSHPGPRLKSDLPRPASNAPFQRLPHEVVLMIAQLLDQEYRVLLSLACRQFSDLLSSTFDLSLNRDEEWTRFALCFERDYPDHLPCRQCRGMYKWRPILDTAFHDITYTCPCKLTRPDFIRCEKIHQFSGVTRELVNLVLRGHDLGPQYGLPLSALNEIRLFTGEDEAYCRMTEARIYKGILFLSIRREVDCAADKTELYTRLFYSKTCSHIGKYSRSRPADVLEPRSIAYNIEQFPRTKHHICIFCWIAFSIVYQLKTNGLAKLVLTTILDCGSRYGYPELVDKTDRTVDFNYPQGGLSTLPTLYRNAPTVKGPLMVRYTHDGQRADPERHLALAVEILKGIIPCDSISMVQVNSSAIQKALVDWARGCDGDACSKTKAGQVENESKGF
ncbi:MAG: hypothetical protein M1814_001157 [Vezdaea aestivalis]|nr:MAG: hypothetical protein M1814_001157 [Vezdaea aestivalis]